MPFCFLLPDCPISAKFFSLKSDNRSMSYGQKTIFKMADAAILNFQNFNFGNVTVLEFNIRCSVRNFIKIERFLTEILRFNDFENGGHPPSWILKICIFFVYPLLTCRFASSYKISLQWDNRSMSYGQKIDFQDGAAILNFKNFNFWSRDCHRVQYLL